MWHRPWSLVVSIEFRVKKKDPVMTTTQPASNQYHWRDNDRQHGRPLRHRQ